MLKLDYRASDSCGLVTWDSADATQPWVALVRRVLLDASDEARQEGPTAVTLPWWNLIVERDNLLAIFQAHGLRPGAGLEVSEAAANLLRKSKRAADGYASARSAAVLPSEQIQSALSTAGFERALSPNQERNVGVLAGIPAGATFSVPGAGKTTEALATFFVRAAEGDRLLVIAPKNAFAAWDEELASCVPQIGASFVRLRGGRDNIARLLRDSPRFMLITYQQLTRVRDIVAASCASSRTHIFLDESHRIKSGAGKQTARAVLSLAHLPVSKLIMSGTPMPQAPDDLIPQFGFLYPEVRATPTDVVQLIRPVYVRTTKLQLNLPPLSRQRVSIPMAPLQSALYKLMKSEVARDAAQVASGRNRQAFRALNRSVAHLLMFVSNPSLLASQIGFPNADLLAGVLAEGDGPKLKYIMKRARSLANSGKKVLIWSSFRSNVEYLAERLADVGAVFIHGGVDAGDEDDDGTREGKIKLFHDDPNVMVMVANPAAAGEGVSLHRVCHHALYLDRTFNAAHYLQSEDRIHRFGLPPDQETFVEIVECKGTVDETVRSRLDFKIGQMAQALNDPSLRPEPVPIDPDDIDDYDSFSTGLSADDIQALLNDLRDGDA